MQQFRIQRYVTSIPLVANQSPSYDLPRGYDYEGLYLRLNGTVQVTVAATSVRAEAPCQAIQRVEVIADGRNTIFSAPFWYCVFGQASSRQSMLENGSRYTTPPSAVGVATYTVEANGIVDFATQDGERPKDSNFRTNGLQLFQLKTTFGAGADMFVGGTIGTVALAVEVNTSELVEIPAADGSVTTPNTLAKVSFQEIAVPTTNANQEIRLPAGNLIKNVCLRTEGSVTAGEPSTAMLNRLQVFSGIDIRVNLTGPGLRGKNNTDFGFIQPGYYFADMTRGGSPTARLSELWDVTNQAEPKVSMDIVGGANNKAQVVVREYLGLKV